MVDKDAHYLMNKGGVYYFTRHVPNDVQQHCVRPRIVQGLKTKSAHTAKTRASVAAAKLDDYWSHLRMIDPDPIRRNLLRPSFKGVFPE